MGPGSFRNTIDDHVGDHNHEKVKGMGKLTSYDSHALYSFFSGIIFKRRKAKALEEYVRHFDAYISFTDSLLKKKDYAAKWKAEVEAWEQQQQEIIEALRDRSKKMPVKLPSPYRLVKTREYLTLLSFEL